MEIKIEGSEWSKASKKSCGAAFPGLLEMRSAVTAMDGMTIAKGTIVRPLRRGTDASGRDVQTISIAAGVKAER